MRKKLLLMMFALLGTVGAWAVQVTYVVTQPNGTCYKIIGENQYETITIGFGNYYVSNDGVLTFTPEENTVNWGVIKYNGFRIRHENTETMFDQSKSSSTAIFPYILTVPDNCTIVSYEFAAVPNGDFNNGMKISLNADMENATTVHKGTDVTTFSHKANASSTTFWLQHANPEASNPAVDVTLSVVVDLPYDLAFKKLLLDIQNDDSCGSGLGQYSPTGEGFEGKTTGDVIAEAQEKFDNEDYEGAIDLLKRAIEAPKALNMPKEGMFFRMKGVNNLYIAAGNATTGTYNKTNALDATTIFYFDGTHLVNLASGQSNNMYENSWTWVYGAEGAAEVEFAPGKESGKYYIKSSDPTSKQPSCYFKDNGTETCVRRAQNPDATKNFDWALIEVTTLPISISNAGYATLWSPVALAIPTNSNLEVYTGIVNGNYLTLVELEGNIIPAKTAVILKGNEGSYNFAVTEGDSAADNDLKGGLGLATASDILTLQQPAEADAIGFYRYTGAGLAGFKAYIENAAGVKGLTFSFGTTDGIATVEGATKEDAAIYNLAGQRVEKAVKGVYIINGKKVLVK